MPSTLLKCAREKSIDAMPPKLRQVLCDKIVVYAAEGNPLQRAGDDLCKLAAVLQRLIKPYAHPHDDPPPMILAEASTKDIIETHRSQMVTLPARDTLNVMALNIHTGSKAGEAAITLKSIDWSSTVIGPNDLKTRIELDTCLAETNLVSKLQLRIGARVVFTVRALGKGVAAGLPKDIAIGTFATVTGIDEVKGELRVLLDSSRLNGQGLRTEVVVHKVRKEPYSAPREFPGGCSRTQYPVQLGYSLTYLQSSGMRFKHVLLFLNKPERSGSLATALDRATEPDGLKILLAVGAGDRLDKETQQLEHMKWLIRNANRPTSERFLDTFFDREV